MMEKTKTDSRLELSDGCEQEETEVNPWVADHPLPLWWKLLVILTGPILLPVRLLLMLLIISFSYICARIALLGGGGRLESQPLRSWRKILQSLVFFNIRCLSVAMGVLVRQRGSQASREEAPLLVAAPPLHPAGLVGLPRHQVQCGGQAGALQLASHGSYWSSSPDSLGGQGESAGQD